MDKCLSNCKRKDRDNEDSSRREAVCGKHTCRKYDTKHLSFGFTHVDVNGGEATMFTLYEHFGRGQRLEKV